MTPERTARRIRAEADHDVALVAVVLELQELQRGFGVLPGRGGLLDDLAAAPRVLERPWNLPRHAGSVRGCADHKQIAAEFDLLERTVQNHVPQVRRPVSACIMASTPDERR